MPPELLLGEHFAHYASDDESHTGPASESSSDEPEAETVHAAPDDPMDMTPPCSDDESDGDVPVDFIEFDEADELSYVVEEAHDCV